MRLHRIFVDNQDFLSQRIETKTQKSERVIYILVFVAITLIGRYPVVLLQLSIIIYKGLLKTRNWTGPILCIISCLAFIVFIKLCLQITIQMFSDPCANIVCSCAGSIICTWAPS